MTRERFLVAHDFEDRRFFVGKTDIPYDFSGAKLRDEIARLAPELEVLLSKNADETLTLAPTVDYMALDKVRRNVFDAATNLKWVHIASSGADHFFKRSDVTADDFRKRKIAITTSKGAGAVVIAEQVLCFMLMFSRNMTRCVRQHLIGHWERYAALELNGMTLGVIGVGAIGSRVAYLAKALGMTVLGCRQNPAKSDPNVDRMYPSDKFREVMAQSDFVLLAVPINSTTSRFIDYDVLSSMKPTAFFMNVARGECINEEELVCALVDGRIAGYASDNHGFPKGEVTDENMERLEADSKLWRMPNVIITPNNAVAGPRRYEYMAKIAVDNYRAMKSGQSMKTRLIWHGEPV